MTASSHTAAGGSQGGVPIDQQGDHVFHVIRPLRFRPDLRLRSSLHQVHLINSIHLQCEKIPFFKFQIYGIALSGKCLECIQKIENGTEKVCTQDGNGTLSCGPFRIGEKYWNICSDEGKNNETGKSTVVFSYLLNFKENDCSCLDLSEFGAPTCDYDCKSVSEFILTDMLKYIL